MQQVVDNPYLNVFDSIGYTLCTRAVIKNIATYAEEGDQSKASCCTINRLYFASGTRQPFRESYFAASGLFMQGLFTGAFWGVVTVIRFGMTLDVTKTSSLFKEAVIVAVSNLACQIIAFAGMCKPQWGVSLWLYMTKQLFDSAGDEIVFALAKGVNHCFKALYPALLFNLGKDKVVGLEDACTSLQQKMVKVGEALKDLGFFEKLEETNVVEDRALQIVVKLIEISNGKAK